MFFRLCFGRRKCPLNQSQNSPLRRNFFSTEEKKIFECRGENLPLQKDIAKVCIWRIRFQLIRDVVVDVFNE